MPLDQERYQLKSQGVASYYGSEQIIGVWECYADHHFNEVALTPFNQSMWILLEKANEQQFYRVQSIIPGIDAMDSTSYGDELRYNPSRSSDGALVFDYFDKFNQALDFFNDNRYQAKFVGNHGHVHIFPIQVGGNHWVLGLLRLTFNDEHHVAGAHLYFHDPLSSSRDTLSGRESRVAEEINKLIKAKFAEDLDLGSSMLRLNRAEQQDVSACGVIISQLGIAIMRGDNQLVDVNYPAGAEALRLQHYNLFDAPDVNPQKKLNFQNSMRQLKPAFTKEFAKLFQQAITEAPALLGWLKMLADIEAYKDDNLTLNNLSAYFLNKLRDDRFKAVLDHRLPGQAAVAGTENAITVVDESGSGGDDAASASTSAAAGAGASETLRSFLYLDFEKGSTTRDAFKLIGELISQYAKRLERNYNSPAIALLGKCMQLDEALGKDILTLSVIKRDPNFLNGRIALIGSAISGRPSLSLEDFSQQAQHMKVLGIKQLEDDWEAKLSADPGCFLRPRICGAILNLKDQLNAGDVPQEFDLQELLDFISQENWIEKLITVHFHSAVIPHKDSQQAFDGQAIKAYLEAACNAAKVQDQAKVRKTWVDYNGLDAAGKNKVEEKISTAFHKALPCFVQQEKAITSASKESNFLIRNEKVDKAREEMMTALTANFLEAFTCFVDEQKDQRGDRLLREISELRKGIDGARKDIQLYAGSSSRLANLFMALSFTLGSVDASRDTPIVDGSVVAIIAAVILGINGALGWRKDHHIHRKQLLQSQLQSKGEEYHLLTGKMLNLNSSLGAKSSGAQGQGAPVDPNQANIMAFFKQQAAAAKSSSSSSSATNPPALGAGGTT